ncbi:MAG: type II toxin-antitoxin system Phd/YefM family antitoxin [Firmicutes bacterium]|nr:type II toxin-antitoxin system Phd/YefM family antitoxin [Candidatus Fiminaster equi]
MQIRPSTALRNQYNEISQYCKTHDEPIYLTRNGEGDLVVMSIKAFEKRERMMKLQIRLLNNEIKRLSGEKTYTIEEVEDELNKMLGS